MEPPGDRQGSLLLQFPYISNASGMTLGAFLERLRPFLASLPSSRELPFEVRNRGCLEPLPLDFLGDCREAFARSAHPCMPPVDGMLDRLDASSGHYPLSCPSARPPAGGLRPAPTGRPHHPGRRDPDRWRREPGAVNRVRAPGGVKRRWRPCRSSCAGHHPRRTHSCGERMRGGERYLEDPVAADRALRNARTSTPRSSALPSACPATRSCPATVAATARRA